MECEWWEKLMNPVRRVWYGVAARLRIRNRVYFRPEDGLSEIFCSTGLLKLRHDVRACEYEDVHIMWDMLRRNETETARSIGHTKNRNFLNCFKWARCTPYVSRSF